MTLVGFLGRLLILTQLSFHRPLPKSMPMMATV